jgi:hypothetical protein
MRASQVVMVRQVPRQDTARRRGMQQRHPKMMMRVRIVMMRRRRERGRQMKEGTLTVAKASRQQMQQGALMVPSRSRGLVAVEQMRVGRMGRREMQLQLLQQGTKPQVQQPVHLLLHQLGQPRPLLWCA